jgi:hypothetical protein
MSTDVIQLQVIGDGGVTYTEDVASDMFSSEPQSQSVLALIEAVFPKGQTLKFYGSTYTSLGVSVVDWLQEIQDTSGNQFLYPEGFTNREYAVVLNYQQGKSAPNSYLLGFCGLILATMTGPGSWVQKQSTTGGPPYLEWVSAS